MPVKTCLILCFAAMTLTCSLTAQSSDFEKNHKLVFPFAEPESQGISSEALDRLSNHVNSLVEHHEIIGGELLVIKNRQTIMQKSFGWKDREAQQRLMVNAIYCVRSMTKPFVGTAIQMLIDEGKLTLETPVHKLLPVFSDPEKKKITINHLMTHTSGLPFSTITRSLNEYADLGDVVDEAATSKLEFEPGKRFHYSDANSDTLGKIVSDITKIPVETFIQQRILDPLGMTDTVTLLGDNADIKARIPAAYSGGTGAWIKHWEPSDSPIFPIFLTSQSLYSTTQDYAKFLAWWMDSGEMNGKYLLTPEAIKRALTPNQQLEDDPIQNKAIKTSYGQQWLIQTKNGKHDQMLPYRFGHDGSDGTYAWAWPGQDLIVLFFTQSRGSLSGIGVEQAVQTLLIEQRLNAQSQSPDDLDSKSLQELTGIYWDNNVEHAYYVITAQDNRLELDRPGGMHVVFKPSNQAGRFITEASPKTWIEFDYSEDGTVIAMRSYFGKSIDTHPRHQPKNSLPTVNQVIKQLRKAHRMDTLSNVSAVRLSGTIEFKDRKIKGSMSNLFDPKRSRTELTMGSIQQTVMIDNGRAWSESTTTGTDELNGRLKQQSVLEQYTVLLGDWNQHYHQIEVLKRIEVHGKQLIMLRVVPDLGAGSTMFVDEKTGLLFRKDNLVLLPGVGTVGVQTLFEDYRQVGDMKIPFHIKSLYSNRLIGRIFTQINKAEIQVETSQDSFVPDSAR